MISFWNNYCLYLFTMKKTFVITILLLAFFLTEVLGVLSSKGTILLADSTYIKLKNEAFERGEKLEYRVHYGWMDAGEAILEIKQEKRVVDDKITYHMIGTGKTLGAFNWFYKVRDRYETYIDEEDLVPLKFIRNVNEGGYIIHQKQIFDHSDNTVNSNGRVMQVPDGIQDMLSAFYYARNLNYDNIQIDDEFIVNTFMDDEIFPLRIRYMGKETIENNIGKFRCLKFHPVVQEGRVFNAEEDLTVWISDDKNHIPVTIEAKLFVGSARMDLKNFEGLVNPLAIVKD